MNRQLDRVYHGLGWCAAVLACAAAALLWCMSLRYTASFDPASFEERLTLYPVGMRRTLPCCLLLLAMLTAADGLLRRRRSLMWPCTAAVAVLGAAYVLSLHGQPIDDQARVWEMAVALSSGDFSAIDPDYFVAYPYQVNMAQLLEPLARLFGHDPYPAFGLMNAVCAGSCVPPLCRIAARLGGRGAENLCGLLCVGFLPLWLTAAFLYGTLAATACALWAVWAAMSLCDGGSRRLWLLVALLFPASLLYSGSLIFAVAVALVLLLDALRGRPLRAVAALVLLAVCMKSNQVGQMVFCWRTGMDFGPGIPKSAWVYMGLTATDTNSAAGGFNSYPKLVFWGNQGNAQATAVAVREDLRTWWKGFVSAPQASWHFFREKICTEWLDPWFTSLTSTYTAEAAPGAFASLFCGTPPAQCCGICCGRCMPPLRRGRCVPRADTGARYGRCYRPSAFWEVFCSRLSGKITADIACPISFACCLLRRLRWAKLRKKLFRKPLYFPCQCDILLYVTVARFGAYTSDGFRSYPSLRQRQI